MHARAFLLAAAFALVLLPAAAASGGHGAEEAEPVAAADMHAEAMADPGVRSIDLAPGQSWSYTFTEEGRFDYHCHPHPWMLAGITVVPSSGRAARNYTVEIMEPSGQSFENWTFSPAVTTIEVGDTVTWVNAGTVVHVVQQTVGEHIAHVGTVGGAAGEGHGEEPAVGDQTKSASIGFPTQGWLWVGAALIGGVFVGRRLTGVKAPRAPAQAPPAQTAPVASDKGADAPASSDGDRPQHAATEAVVVAQAPHTGTHGRSRDRRRQRRERRRNRA